MGYCSPVRGGLHADLRKLERIREDFAKRWWSSRNKKVGEPLANLCGVRASSDKYLLQQQQREQERQQNIRHCNCRSKDTCPLEGECLKTSVVYLAKLKVKDGSEHHYIGMTEGTFKARFNSHNSSFRHQHRRGETKLSEKVWSLKDQGLSHNIKWSIMRRGQPYKVGRNSCDLCTSEKLEILKNSSDPRLLNSRTEILAKCRHKRKFLL